jgi:hypothetical protein
VDKRLGKAEKEELAEKALTMSCKGRTYASKRRPRLGASRVFRCFSPAAPSPLQ